MAGVYDIGKHYEHETMRGVQYLSTMARAMGGRSCFESQSPACILARALQKAADRPLEPETDSYYGCGRQRDNAYFSPHYTAGVWVAACAHNRFKVHGICHRRSWAGRAH
jgi:hypothetical protein